LTKKQQFDKAKADHAEEERLIKSLQQEQRQRNRQTMDENRQFMAEWEAENKKNWLLNRKR